MYLRYCTISGSSNPFCLFQEAICAPLARKPSTALAGDGKIACSSTKMKMEMPIRTMMDVPIRRSR